MKTIAFFNNKGGVGKTTLVYHLAHMLAEMGESVLAADLDPQSNLTSMFLQEERLTELWPDGEHPLTVYGALRPIVKGTGDIVDSPWVERIDERLGLVVGDLALSTFEDKLSDAWPRCHNHDEAAFRTITAFHRILGGCAQTAGATIVLIDVGPNLGAINRAALIASDWLVVPLGPDLFSMQGLRNLGPTVIQWRQTWGQLRSKCPSSDLDRPVGSITPLGYVVLQHGVRKRGAPAAYQRWLDRFPAAYRQAMWPGGRDEADSAALDPHCLQLLPHYRSLMPMAMEARKPLFRLKPADGAIGAHGQAVQRAHQDFKRLAERVRLVTQLGQPVGWDLFE